MTDLEHFDGFQVRFVGTPERPEWVGADVVNVLYPAAIVNKDQHKYLAKVPDEWKDRKPVPTPGGIQEMTTLLEPGLYFLISRSDSPRAILFQKWAFGEVLPAIRRTGSYNHNPQPILPPSLLELRERKERLEIIQICMDLCVQLGGIDQRTELKLKDIVQNIALADVLSKPALSAGSNTGRMEWPISDRISYLGYPPQEHKILIRIGRAVASAYRLKYRQEPPKREQFVDGATRPVNCYSEEHIDLLDPIIKQILDNS